PISIAVFIGVKCLTPPSTQLLPSISIGQNAPGKALEAMTPSIKLVSFSLKTLYSPVFKHTAPTPTFLPEDFTASSLIDFSTSLHSGLLLYALFFHNACKKLNGNQCL